MANHLNKIMSKDSLAKLIQKENFVGWIYSMNYNEALVMTNDLWKAKVKGIPYNGFLLATLFDPDEFLTSHEDDQQVILLRVIGTSKLPQDDDLVQTKIDHFQSQQNVNSTLVSETLDPITTNQLQFGGLQCRVLGTFYKKDDGKLYLGSDIESFATSTKLNVYKPQNESLEMIVNYVDPIRLKKAEEEAKELGMSGAVKPFKIGTVRYTSTDRMNRQNQKKVPVFIQPSDFLARRTAVLGMTRTGKSNTIKQTVSTVKRVADEEKVKIGQIIYDINGEYANANKQDKGSIAEVYGDSVIRYRMLQTPGFKELQNNFYVQLTEGHSLIKQALEESAISTASADLQVFLNISFEEPGTMEIGDHNRWKVKVAAYKALLRRADFESLPNATVKFPVNKEVMKKLNEYVERERGDGATFPDPNEGISLKEAIEFFTLTREVNTESKLLSTSKKPWLDDETISILNLLTNKREGGSYINGYKNLIHARKYHSPRRNEEVGEEIYNFLLEGKIIILDLSVGNPTIRAKLSEQIGKYIFNKSMNLFIEGGTPPNILIYIEEAHNLIGKKHELTETWPRLAKEGAKYKLGLVYATQEISSVHPNILANTENWFVSHINNMKEINELSNFYDFKDFADSIKTAQDVGFARVKTLSGPFVLPIQVDIFDPEKEKENLLRRNRME